MSRRRTQTTAVALDGTLYVSGGSEKGGSEASPPTTLEDRTYTVGGGAAPSAEETRKLEIMSVEE